MCGIVAYTGSKPADANIIKLLMMYNQERGEDGTGWCINDTITKSTDKVSKFLQENEIVTSESDENYTIIAHARKCSSGNKHSRDLVHPFGIYKDSTEKDKYDLVLAMNGTLFNDDELAKKYDIKTTYYQDSDTKIVAKAMASLGDKGFRNILEEYDGTMTLVFFSPKFPNTLMVYKDTDRPLFMWQKSKEEAYISSLEESLKALGAKDIKTFEGESLYRLSKGKITKKEKIIRTPLKRKVVTTTWPTTAHGGGTKYQNRYDSAPGTRAWAMQKFSQQQTPFHEEDVLDVLEEFEKDKVKKITGDKVYLMTDRYQRNGHPCTGKFILDKDGKVMKEGEEGGITYFIIFGYMCKGEKEYDELYAKCKGKDGFDPRKFTSYRLSELIEFFKYPLLTIIENKEKWILGAAYASLVSKVGDSIVLDMFLSDFKYSIQFNDKFAEITHKYLCDFVKATSKDNGPVANTPDSRKKIKDEIVRLIIDNQVNDSLSWHYQRVVLNVIKKNHSDETKALFYDALVEILNEKGIISPENYTEFTKKDNEVSYFNIQRNLNELEYAFKLLHTQLKKEAIKNEDDDTTVIDNTVNKQALNPSMTTSEKIRTLGEETPEFTVEEVIDSIKAASTYYQNMIFKDEILDALHKDLAGILEYWTVHGKDRETCEAVLLCLNTVGKIGDQELLVMLTTPTNILKEQTNDLYDSWYKYIQRTVPKRPLITQVSTMIEQQKEVDDEIISEILNDEDFEQEMEWRLTDCIDTMEEVVKEITNSDIRKTTRVDQIKVHLEDAVRVLKKHTKK